jgi:hypothetical protein
MPLTRLNPWYPGQFGVPGAWTETGLRMHPTGAVFWVDPNHPDANDQRDGTDPTAPLATVARALALCQAFRGDVIAIAANDFWTHGSQADYALPITESVTVTVPGVRIVGLSQSNTLGVYWQPAAVDGVCITVHAIDVLIEGIGFMGRTGGTGILAEWDGATTYGDNLTVRYCFFDDAIDEGIITDFPTIRPIGTFTITGSTTSVRQRSACRTATGTTSTTTTSTTTMRRRMMPGRLPIA